MRSPQRIPATTANYYFASKILGEKMPVDPKTIESLTTKEQLSKSAADSFAYAHKALAAVTPENAYASIEGADGLHTRSIVASFTSAHGYDHYGQMIESLRTNGIVPPGSKEAHAGSRNPQLSNCPFLDLERVEDDQFQVPE